MWLQDFNKLNKSYCNTKYHSKNQAKKYKRKIIQLINDDKTMYLREDLAYNLILYSNLDVIESCNFKQSINSKRKRNNSHNNDNICGKKYAETM